MRKPTAYEVEDQLKDLSLVLNVKEPSRKYLSMLSNMIVEKFISIEHMEKVLYHVVQSYTKNSYPKPSDFFKALDANQVDYSRKPQDWEEEYSEKLNIPVEKIMVMKIEDYNDYQRQILGLYTRQEAIDFLKTITGKDARKVMA